MSTEMSSKVQARHLSRKAYLYVRQSTMRQVFENTESTKRQYALQQRAVALGWRIEDVALALIETDPGLLTKTDPENSPALKALTALGRRCRAP